MNILSQIIERLNQRINVGNIFDQFYGLSDYFKEENAYYYYIGDGQALPVTNYDSKQGTIFWSKRGKTIVNKQENLRLAGCKSVYETRYLLTAYCMVRKSHLPCDSAESQDWVATRVLRLVSGQDAQFKQSIGVVAYEVLPSGYQTDSKVLPPNLEWAAVAVEIDIIVSTFSEDGCYDACNVGDIPLPDFQTCSPCLIEVSVDGVTIIGNGTPQDPLVAIGGGGGGGLLLALPFTTDHISANGNQYLVGNVVWYNGNVYRCIANNDSIVPTNGSYWTNLGGGYPLVQQPIDWNSSSGNNQILNKPTIPTATSQLTNDSGYITIGDVPPQVNSDWNAVSGVSEILNKPTIPVVPPTIVESVTATLPITSSGGANPDISISQSSSSSDGYLSSTDWSTFDNKQDTLTAGTGIDLTGNVVTNTAPDQIVGLTAGTNIAVSGTYPSFTIDNTQDLSGYVPYTGATTDVDLGTNKLTTDALEFSLTPVNAPSSGQIAYVGNTGALAYNMNGSAVTSQIGQTLHAFVHNADSVTINKGQPVYLFGASGNKASVKLANNTSDATSAKTFGLAAEDITSGQNGFVIVQGVIDGLNTGAYTAGDTLYVGATAGTLTSTKPYAPNHLVYVGVVEKANNGNGQIYVRIQNGYMLDEIHDVDLITTPPVNKDILTYVTGSPNLWKNRSLGSILGGTTSQYVRGDGSLATFPSTGSVTSVSASVSSPTNPALSVNVTNPTTTPAIAITANGTTSQYVRGDGSLATMPSTSTIYKSTTDGTAITLVATEQISSSQLITANTFAVGDILNIAWRCRKTGVASSPTFKLYVNTTASLVGATQLAVGVGNQTAAFSQLQRTLVIKSATNTEVLSAAANVFSDFTFTSAVTAANINWAVDQYIIFMCQLSTATADVVRTSFYQIEKI